MSKTNQKSGFFSKKNLITGLIFIVCLVLLESFLMNNYKNSVKQDQEAANLYSELVVSSIYNTFQNAEIAGDSINNCFANPETFSESFNFLGKKYAESSPAIKSISFATEGIISNVYPESAAEKLIGFNILEDTLQGSKAKFATEKNTATIAGPYYLAEGGIGFILRVPAIINDQKVITSISFDNEKLLEEIKSDLPATSENYAFKIWKDEDFTAVTDEDDYILKSTDKRFNQVVDISFQVPNDTWHISIEPEKGWHPFAKIKTDIILSFVLIILIIILVNLIMASTENKKKIKQQNQENLETQKQFQNKMMHDSQLKTNFMLNMAHLVKEAPDSKELKSLADSILVMEENFELTEAPLNIKDFDSQVFIPFEKRCEEKNITLKKTISVENSDILCDSEKLQKIYNCILDNACKFTPAGGLITITLKEVISVKDDYAMYKTIIKDSGCGISEEFLPHIFEEFSRDANSKNVASGAGLGLSSAKKLLDLMNAKIEYESEPGKGTEVTLIFEHKIAQQEQ